MQLQNILKEFFNENTLDDYIGRHIENLGSSTYIEFEQVRDLGEPINKWISFIFYNRKIKN